GPLCAVGLSLICKSCGAAFPIIDGTPILLNEANSAFRIADYSSQAGYGGASAYSGSLDNTSGLRKAYRTVVHRLTEAPIYGGPRFDPLPEIRRSHPAPRILILGAGERQRDFDAVLTDVALSKHLSCVCDAHDIPFPDGTFDAVLAESILEHVCD